MASQAQRHHQKEALYPNRCRTLTSSISNSTGATLLQHGVQEESTGFLSHLATTGALLNSQPCATRIPH
ncbi:hypothetical protein DY000_02011428 [Brassica cretica]|uniref:Uncharacterized protein n=1 Tax=Brassica cretica TaxID=69181 RepID=A0ABQ7CKS8_BRACR|nr:hypothetical protein DY000_02011428 [Brassica cretica]